MRPCFLRLTTVVVAVLAASLAACGDDVTDPDSMLASAEAEAVMRSAGALPSLPALADLVGPVTPQQQAALYRARELWAAGVADHARGDARRRLAVGYAAPVLALGLPEDAFVQVRDRIDEWQEMAEGMLRHIAMPAVEARLEAARRQLARADAAATPRARIYHLLLASSELVETTPRHVARSLTADAEAAVRRAEARSAAGDGTDGTDGTDGIDGVAPSAAQLERARRLKDWAARAVEEEEYLLAIQRAYYAIQLAEGR